jgi:lysophospholipase L1-like esterase
MNFATPWLACLVTLAVLAPNSLRAESVVKDGQTVAFLGDSITQGGWQNPAGYVRLIVAGLSNNGVNIKPVPAGISGHKSDQMLARLDRDVLSKKPDWMTLSCGVNDVWHGEKGIPLDRYQSNITAIVEKCAHAGVKVVLLTSTPIGENIANANNQKLAPYNDFVRTLAKEKKLLLADLSADFAAKLKDRPADSKANSLTSDGVHMNAAGNRIMALGVLRAFGLDEAQLKKAEEAWRAASVKPATLQ